MSECPTPMHHPLTVCPVCHPDEYAARRPSVGDELAAAAEALIARNPLVLLFSPEEQRLDQAVKAWRETR